MTVPPTSPIPAVAWTGRTEVRLAAFGLAAVAAVSAGFLGVGVTAAESFIRTWGYHVMASTFVAWLWALARVWRSRPRQPWAEADRRAAWACAALVAVFTLLGLVHEQFRSKILFDEFVVQSTAFNMHFFREVATMVRGYDLLGVFASTDNYLDKRPYFFPFLLSLSHDLTGYRPANAYALNAVLYPCALLLVAWIGRLLAAWRGAFTAVALLGSLPLLAQNASGSGLELLNLVMLLASAVLATHYLAEPGDDRLVAFLLGVLLLAQTRYESALFVAPAAAIVLLGWWRAGRIVLPWPVVAVPLLLVPLALHNKVLSNSPVLWELRENQSSRFSADYLSANLAGAGRFLLSTDHQQANSLLLLALGVAGAAWVAWRLVRRPAHPRTADPAALALLCLGGGVLANAVLVQFYYWASFDDPMSARFALPLLVVLAFAAVALVARLDRFFPATALVLVAAAMFTAGVAIPKQAHHLYSHLGIDEIEWEREVVARRPPVPRLVLTNKSTLPWLLDRTPSILIGRARLVADRLARQLREPTIQEILVTQSLRPASAQGDHQMLAEERLPAWFRLEPVAERRFGTKIARISRLVAVDLPADYPDSNSRRSGRLPAADKEAGL